MITEIIVFTLTFIVGYFFYLHKLATNRFKQCGVKFVPCWPIFGNVFYSAMMKKHILEDINAVYKAFPNEK